jgi:hypothetical protein
MRVKDARTMQRGNNPRETKSVAAHSLSSPPDSSAMSPVSGT